MTERVRQWTVAAATVTFVAAAVLGWSAYLHARSTPRYQQTAAGAAADPLHRDGMPLRLASLTVTPSLVTDREASPAPSGALWVLAVVEYEPVDGGSCLLDLLAVDGRRWSRVDLTAYRGDRTLEPFCSAAPGTGAARAELVYLIPADAAGSLAGLVSTVTGYRGTEPYRVLTPPG